MAEKRLIPSIEKRLESLIEVGRRNLSGYSVKEKEKAGPTITISREFGCEGYPAAEKLQALLQEKTGKAWALMDKALLEEVARNHHLSTDVLKHLGEKNSFLDDMMSTFSPHWQNDKDAYKLLCRQIVAFAAAGNAIIVGVGASILTQKMGNCHHFRLIAPAEFKKASIARRLAVTTDEAEKLISRKQRQREDFIKDFLGRDVADPTLYHLIFNNGKNSAEQIAATICHYVLSR
jgi:cytidylate kinase